MKKKDKVKKLAKVCISPELVAINSIKKFVQPNGDVIALQGAIIEEAKKIEAGDISRIEQHLYSQALALNAMFDRAIFKLGEATLINEVQIYAQLGLKAQAQCRVTLTALADLKNPNRTTFVKNQNNAIQVNQQVNNMLPLETIEIPTRTELISEVTHETLDFRGTPETISAYSRMGTVEAVNRPNK
jgi:hypothetical protein